MSRMNSSRRSFLTRTAGIGAGVAVTAALLNENREMRAGSEPSDLNADGTWLTYAVNLEMTWGRMPFLEKLRKVREAGFSHYEFWPWWNKDIEGIIRLNKELGLTPTQFSTTNRQGFSHGITNPDPARREEFVVNLKKDVEVAKRLGVKKMCVVAGEEAKGYTRDEQTQAVIDTLKAGAKIVEPEGITLILEPLNVLVDHPRQLIVHSAHAAHVIRAVGSPNVKILFDIYHQQISEGNLTGNIRKYKDLIGYFQLADHPGRHEPTTGEINYPFVLKTIHEISYRGAIGMEMSPKKDPTTAFKAIRQIDAAARALERAS